MITVKDTVSLAELRRMAKATFGDLVKAVVDVRLGKLALDSELHADLEAKLLAEGSQRADLWGINLYPDAEGDGFIEFNSMINVRPSQGNRSFTVQSEETRKGIIELVTNKVRR